MRDLNKFQGCLIGGAIGDALGYAVEFISANNIFNEYGPNGITDYHLQNGIAQISDDTQMTLFTATGLLIGTTRGRLKGVGANPEVYIAYSYKDWYRTQTETFPLKEEFRYSWLSSLPQMFHRRAPGLTCLSAIRQGCDGTLENPINNSKGCGGIMRVAPIGLYYADRKITQDSVDLIAARTAALTHGHELGYIPAAMFVHILQRITTNAEPIDIAISNALSTIPQLFPHSQHISELIDLINKAIDLSQNPQISDLAAITQLGEGWVAEETLAIAIYCVLKYPTDFQRAIIASVNHNGDSDSTGSVAGNIIGASLGLSSIPPHLLSPLELKDTILEVAEDLYNDCPLFDYDTPSTPTTTRWEQKYVHMFH